MKNKLVIAVAWNKWHEDYAAWFTPLLRVFPNVLRTDMKVYGKYSSDVYYLRSTITRSVSHELGHASHWQTVINTKGAGRVTDYLLAEKQMYESYARTVEFYLTSLLYDKQDVSEWIEYHDEYKGGVNP